MPGFTNLKDSKGSAPIFVQPAEPCPTTTFRGYVKQVKPSAMSQVERNFLDMAFGGFLTETIPVGDVHAMLLAANINTFHEDRLPRRYDGDQTLPRGSYYTICEHADGNDSGTLCRELLYYKKAGIAGAHFEIYDPAIDKHREMIKALAMDTDSRERIVVHFIPFTQEKDREHPYGFTLSIPVELEELCVDNVLDLRRPASLKWVFDTLPGLQITLTETGDTIKCFPNRPPLATFAEVLPSLLDQARGGGNFDKLLGLYLRHLGVSGLVFPSVRSDAYTYAVDGEPKEFHGWSFVNYKNAPKPEIVSFYELRPDWPNTLMIEGGDDHHPTPAAFAEEFRIHMTENFPLTGGTLLFRGLSQRIEAYHLVDSMEAAIRFRLRNITEEEINQLKQFTVSLGSVNAKNFATMVVFSLLGMKQAQTDLHECVNTQLKELPVTSILTCCVNPPPLDENEVKDYYANFFSLLGRQ